MEFNNWWCNKFRFIQKSRKAKGFAFRAVCRSTIANCELPGAKRIIMLSSWFCYHIILYFLQNSNINVTNFKYVKNACSYYIKKAFEYASEGGLSL